jgi:hypothetical protein
MSRWGRTWFLAGALACVLAAPAGADDRVLPFIADDYAKALAEARTQRLPLFVECWAPW